MSNYFCPDCGWEGTEATCALCGAPTESLEVDPNTGKVVTEETLIPTDDDFDKNLEKGDDDELTAL